MAFFKDNKGYVQFQLEISKKDEFHERSKNIKGEVG